MRRSDPVRIVGGNYEAAITDSGELNVTVTERENDVWTQYAGAFSATTYIVLISKDNNLFPHKRQGQNGKRIDITSAYYAIDLAANTTAQIKIGVITRIDGTNADIKYAIGIPFLSGASKTVLVETLRGVPSQVKLDFNDAGTLLHGITNIKEANIAAVNTTANLGSPAGNIKPGLGDVVLKYEHTNGSSNVGIFLFYHNTD